MDELLLDNFNKIIEMKNKEVEIILLSKNKKMTNKSLEIDYETNKTINKIKNEEKRKLENSKLYKKKMDNNKQNE